MVYFFQMKKREPKEYVIQPKGWKKRYECHKNKGDHTYELIYAEEISFYRQGILEHYECSACGKKKMYFLL